MEHGLSSNCRTTIRQSLSYLKNNLSVDAVLLVRQLSNQFHIEFVSGTATGLYEGLSGTWEGSIFDFVVEGRAPTIAPDVLSIPLANVPFLPNYRLRSFASTVIDDPSGGLYGMLCGISSSPIATDTSASQTLLEFCAEQIKFVLASELFVLEQSAHIDVLAEQAYSDQMTGLINRNGWDRVISAAMDNQRQGQGFVSIFVIDLDDLKTLNDSDGHASGDRVILQVASELIRLFSIACSSDDSQGDNTIFAAHLAQADKSIQYTSIKSPFYDDGLELNNNKVVVARTGGDEFCAMMIGIDDEFAALVADSVMKELDDVGMPVSVGYACCRQPSKLQETIRSADHAMYAEKKRRKNEQRRTTGILNVLPHS